VSRVPWRGRARLRRRRRQPTGAPERIPVECEECRGRGYFEERLPPIGGHLHWIRTRELYPRFVETLADGSVRLQQRDNVLSRTQLQDFRHDLERLVAQLDSARETGLFPAVSGHHCVECPASPECPLPAHLREWRGRSTSPEQAAEAAEWADRMGDERRSKVNAEVKRWAGENDGRVRYGVDLVREFKASPTTACGSRRARRTGMAC
jgi:hypothetical protein